MTWGKHGGVGQEGERDGGTAFTHCFFHRCLFSPRIATFKRGCKYAHRSAGKEWRRSVPVLADRQALAASDTDGVTDSGIGTHSY